MSTSHPATGLPRPTADEKISLGTFGYINARNRQRAYDIVIKELKKSGLTQAALASRMGKSADVVCRLLSRPQNWESDTFSSLLFAISGAIPKYGVTYPLGVPDFAEEPAVPSPASVPAPPPATRSAPPQTEPKQNLDALRAQQPKAHYPYPLAA
jgi:hypothetical protein